MIHASFDGGAREAVATDVFQYDTGQTLALSGLPGDMEAAAVEVHYGFDGDEQAETRAAHYDRRTALWLADVPDIYLRRACTVRAHVYAIRSQSQACTLYRASFTPIARPAPSTEVTPAQNDAWAELVIQVNAAIAGADAAASRATAAAAAIQESADAWETRLQAVEARVPGNMVQEIARMTLSVPAEGWAQGEAGMWEKTMSAAETIANSQTQRVRYGVAGSQIGRVMLAGCRVDEDGTLTMICLTQPQAAFELDVSVEEVVKVNL